MDQSKMYLSPDFMSMLMTGREIFMSFYDGSEPHVWLNEIAHQMVRIVYRREVTAEHPEFAVYFFNRSALEAPGTPRVPQWTVEKVVNDRQEIPLSEVSRTLSELENDEPPYGSLTLLPIATTPLRGHVLLRERQGDKRLDLFLRAEGVKIDFTPHKILRDLPFEGVDMYLAAQKAMWAAQRTSEAQTASEAANAAYHALLTPAEV